MARAGRLLPLSLALGWVATTLLPLSAGAVSIAGRDDGGGDRHSHAPALYGEQLHSSQHLASRAHDLRWLPPAWPASAGAAPTASGWVRRAVGWTGAATGELLVSSGSSGSSSSSSGSGSAGSSDSNGDSSLDAAVDIGMAGLIVDLVICLASILGALSIIVPYVVNKRQRKLRHALIVGLATSDLLAALVIVATTAYLLDGRDLGEDHRFCDFAGVVVNVSVFTQHLWNLAIGIITYLILVHPLVRFAACIQPLQRLKY